MYPACCCLISPFFFKATPSKALPTCPLYFLGSISHSPLRRHLLPRLSWFGSLKPSTPPMPEMKSLACLYSTSRQHLTHVIAQSLFFSWIPHHHTSLIPLPPLWGFLTPPAHSSSPTHPPSLSEGSAAGTASAPHWHSHLRNSADPWLSMPSVQWWRTSTQCLCPGHSTKLQTVYSTAKPTAAHEW